MYTPVLGVEAIARPELILMNSMWADVLPKLKQLQLPKSKPEKYRFYIYHHASTLTRTFIEYVRQQLTSIESEELFNL